MSPLRGILLKLTSVLMFTVMAALVKAATEEVPTGQVVFFRSFFAMPVIVFWLWMRGDMGTGLKAERPMGHVWRGVIGVSAMGCNFAALGLLPLPEVTALGYAAPILTVLLAAVLLGERLRLFRMSAVLLGLVGVAVVLWPRLTLDHLGGAALIGVGFVMTSAGLRALAQIHIRRLVQSEQTSAIVFYFSLTSTVLSLVTLPFGWVVPDLRMLGILIAMGLIGGVAQIILTSSYKFAQVAVLAPFEYASILFSIVLGYMFFDEVPTVMVLVGSAIVVAAGVMIVLREAQLGLQRGRARSTMTPNG